MKQETYELFKNNPIDSIVTEITQELNKRNESPFWADKVEPFSRAILSVLVPLRDNNLLFDPQGVYQESLTPELFLEWSDFLSLKNLAFTVQKSNSQAKLLRTKIEPLSCAKYEKIDLTLLGDYLAKHNVDLGNEQLDFPISAYNLHQGVSNVIKSLF